MASWNDYTDQATRDMFTAVWGDKAEAQWLKEDAANHPERYSSSPSGGSSSSGSASVPYNQTKDFFTNQAGQDAAALAQQGKAQQATAKYQQGLLANSKATLKAQIKQWKSETKFKYAELEATKGKYAADAWYQQQEINVALLAHQDDMARIGLDYVKQGVEYASTPDNYFKLLDFQAGAAQRQDVPMFLQALQGTVNASAFQQAGGSPTAKNPNDVLSLLGFSGSGTQLTPTQLAQQQASTVTTTGASAPITALAGTGGQDVTASASDSNVVDPRQAAALGVVSAVPPSPTAGITGQDATALSTIMDIYNSPNKIAPGAWESTPLTAKKLFLAGVSRGGGDQSMFLDRLTRMGVNQGAGNAA